MPSGEAVHERAEIRAHAMRPYMTTRAVHDFETASAPRRKPGSRRSWKAGFRLPPEWRKCAQVRDRIEESEYKMEMGTTLGAPTTGPRSPAGGARWACSHPGPLREFEDL